MSTAFSRSTSPSAVQPCAHPCSAAHAKDEQLSAAAHARLQALTGRPEAAKGLLPGDDKPLPLHGMPTSDPRQPPNCRERAERLGPYLRRFNRYREALPYARAANDMNQRLGAHAQLPDKPVEETCLTRLPVEAQALNEALGLPKGTLLDEHLRDESTGFRAVMYRDEASGRLILVPRDTNPKSLADWVTNTRNGAGLDTDQYRYARELSQKLAEHGVSFDLAGYSKGGGLAQEMALMNTQAKAVVFNAAGLHENSLARTGNQSFSSLVERTRSFSARDDFLTFMNTTADPAKQIRNAEFLLAELNGNNRWLVDPLQIGFRAPAFPDGAADPAFQAAQQAYAAELGGFVNGLKLEHAAGKALRSFPPVRSSVHETIANSASTVGNRLGASGPEANLGKLNQHLMKNVIDPLESTVRSDRKALTDFLRSCP